MMDLWANDDVSYDSLSCAISALALPGVGAGPAEMRGRRGLGWSVRCGHTPGPSGAGWMPSIRTEAGHNLVVVARPWGGQAPSSCSLLSGVGFYDCFFVVRRVSG